MARATVPRMRSLAILLLAAVCSCTPDAPPEPEPPEFSLLKLGYAGRTLVGLDEVLSMEVIALGEDGREVALRAVGVPPAASVELSPSILRGPGDASRLTIAVAATAPQTIEFSIEGEAGELFDDTPVKLEVTDQVTFRSRARGFAVDYDEHDFRDEAALILEVAVEPINGFAAPVTVEVQGYPFTCPAQVVTPPAEVACYAQVYSGCASLEVSIELTDGVVVRRHDETIDLECDCISGLLC